MCAVCVFFFWWFACFRKMHSHNALMADAKKTHRRKSEIKIAFVRRSRYHGIFWAHFITHMKMIVRATSFNMKDHNCYLFIVFTTLLSVLQEKTWQRLWVNLHTHTQTRVRMCLCVFAFIFSHSRFHYYLENAFWSLQTNAMQCMHYGFSTEIMYAKWFWIVVLAHDRLDARSRAITYSKWARVSWWEREKKAATTRQTPRERERERRGRTDRFKQTTKQQNFIHRFICMKINAIIICEWQCIAISMSLFLGMWVLFG